jgi:hypothetical protein
MRSIPAITGIKDPSIASILQAMKENIDQLRAITDAFFSTPAVGSTPGTWKGTHIILGYYHFWVDETGDLRICHGAPASDTDGTVVGVQS